MSNNTLLYDLFAPMEPPLVEVSRTPAETCICEYAQRAAISLNNDAVGILVRGYCAQALETFEDAVQLMERVSSSSSSLLNSSSICHTPTTTIQDIQRIFDHASKRIASCSIGGSQNPNKDVYWPQMHVISSQSNPTRVYEILTTCLDSSALNVTFPVTIDPMIDEDDDDSGNTTTKPYATTRSNNKRHEESLQMGVLLHNYGIAYTCVASRFVVAPPVLSPLGGILPHQQQQQQQQHQFRAMIQAKAFHIFQWSSAIFAKLDLETSGHLPPGLTSSLLLLRTVLTHNLINVSIVLNLDYEYNEYCHIMQTLLQLVEAHHSLLPIDDHHIAAAA